VTADAIQKLLDLEEIRSLRYRYFRCLDAQDWAGYMALFTDDVEFFFTVPEEQFVPPGAMPTPEGWARIDRDGLLAWVKASSEGFTTVHISHMPVIEFTGPDTATGDWTMTDYTRWDASGDPTWYAAYGGHNEDYVRTADGWRIGRVRFTRHDFDTFPVPESAVPPPDGSPR
jgi:hypothetical protein